MYEASVKGENKPKPTTTHDITHPGHHPEKDH